MDEHDHKTKLDEAIEEAAKKLSPMNPVTYSGDYKYWSGLCDARNIMRSGSAVADAGPDTPREGQPA